MKTLQASPVDDIDLACALLTIQHAAYALEAVLIDDERIPALHENIEELRSAALLWLVAFHGSRPVGAVAWNENDEELDIDRLVVTPEMHRRGVGSSLIRRVLQRAGKRSVIVSTAMKNTPAKTMYERLGFTHVKDVEVLQGLMVTRYCWNPPHTPTHQ